MNTEAERFCVDPAHIVSIRSVSFSVFGHGPSSSQESSVVGWTLMVFDGDEPVVLVETVFRRSVT